MTSAQKTTVYATSVRGVPKVGFILLLPSTRSWYALIYEKSLKTMCERADVVKAIIFLHCCEGLNREEPILRLVPGPQRTQRLTAMKASMIFFQRRHESLCWCHNRWMVPEVVYREGACSFKVLRCIYFVEPEGEFTSW